ncbi:Uncharacterised protein [Vibrio cholerae]|nr:Uncharacterised protein [Vibrio cholerae]
MPLNRPHHALRLPPKSVHLVRFLTALRLQNLLAQ